MSGKTPRELVRELEQAQDLMFGPCEGTPLSERALQARVAGNPDHELDAQCDQFHERIAEIRQELREYGKR